MTDTAQLATLARELRLTKPQRLFVEGLATGKTQRQAAIDAGSKDPDVTGWKWQRLAKVQKYLKALTQVAVEKANRRTRGTVASLADALIVTSDIMRGNLGKFITENGDVDLHRVRKAPAGVVKKLETTVRRIAGSAGSDAIEERTTKLELRDSLTAAGKLIDYYQPANPAPVQGVQVNVVNVLPTQLVAQVYKALIAGGNGNRHYPEGQA